MLHRRLFYKELICCFFQGISVLFRERFVASLDKIMVECSWSPLEAIVDVLWRTHCDNGEIEVVDGVGGDRGGDWLLLPLLVRLPDQQPSSDETSAHNYHPQNLGTLGLNLNGVR